MGTMRAKKTAVSTMRSIKTWTISKTINRRRQLQVAYKLVVERHGCEM